MAWPGRVTEVQNPPHTRLALVGRDDIRFDAARLRNHRCQYLRLAREDGGPLLGEPVEEARARRHPVLHDFVQARAKLPSRQRAEHRRVDDHGVRLVERADEVLAKGMVDADFAANRAIDLRQQRGGHVDQRDAAEVGGGRKPGHVPDHAAAKGDDRRRALGVRAHERVVDSGDRGQVLVALAVRDEDRLALDGPSEARTVKPPDKRARNHEPAFGRVRCVEHPVEVFDGLVFDGDAVRAGRRRDVDTQRRHAESNARITPA